MNAIWVKWIDANRTHGWQDDDDLKDFTVFEALIVGFVVKENDLELILSSTYADDNKGKQAPYNCPVAIPKVAILERGVVDLIPHEGAKSPTFMYAGADGN